MLYDIIYDGNRNAIKSEILDTLRRARWKKIPYSRALLFTLVITDNCTLRCEHCCEEAGPEKNTFLDSHVIDELAKEADNFFESYPHREIRITGGDPFLHPDIYQIIKSFTKRRDVLSYNVLDVETNGWWATDNETTKKHVRMLKRSGVDLLSMTVDYYHCKQGKFNIYEHADRIENTARKEDLQFRHIKSGTNFSKDEEIKREEEKHAECCNSHMDGLPLVTPIGRGRLLHEKYWGDHTECIAKGCRLNPPTLFKVKGVYLHRDELTIGANGNVYPCNSGKEFEHVTLSIGNIYDDTPPVHNPIVELIQEKGLRGLSREAGISLREHWKMYYKMSPCGWCHEILREHGKTLAEKLYN